MTPEHLALASAAVGDGTKERYQGAAALASKVAEYVRVFIEETDGGV